MTDSKFSAHVQHLQQLYEQGLELPELQNGGIEAILIHSGSEGHYYADDRGISFQAFGHFCHWLPVNRPDQFVYVSADQRPIYFQVVPGDFWYDQSISLNEEIEEEFDVIRLGSVPEIKQHLPGKAMAFLGESSALAESLGVAVDYCNQAALLHFLDYQRAYKTEYELEQLRGASERALNGHKAARESFLSGGNEYDIHMAYLAASQQLEDECPYTNIVALDEKAAILHYQYKRREPSEQCQVLLIDAGCRVNGYGSDITRTWTKASVHPVFNQLLAGMDELEQSLVAAVKPGDSYLNIHLAALAGIATLLAELEICSAPGDELLAAELPQLFMPHGVGHLLGIQVHDVAGHQLNVSGDIEPPPAHSPALRNTRTMGENMVFTIEPGCYFIPMLLEPERDSARGKLINWSLVDELYACGGIRIEDNIRVTATGAENLTRQFDIIA